MTAALVAFVSFVAGAVFGGRLARHLDDDVRRWLTVALGIEVVVLLTLSILTGTGVLDYHDNTKLILIAGLALTFGSQNATARQFGIQELSTTVLTSTIVGHRLRQPPCRRHRAAREAALQRGAHDVRGGDGRRHHDPVGCRAGDRARRGRGGRQRRDLPVRPAQRRGSTAG